MASPYRGPMVGRCRKDVFLACNKGGSSVTEDSEDKGLQGDGGTLVKPAELPATDLGPQTHKQTRTRPAGLATGTVSTINGGVVTALFTMDPAVRGSAK